MAGDICQIVRGKGKDFRGNSGGNNDRDLFDVPDGIFGNQSQGAGFQTDQIRSLLASPLQSHSEIEIVKGLSDCGIVSSEREFLILGDAGQLQSISLREVQTDRFGVAINSKNVLGKCSVCGEVITSKENFLRCVRCKKVLCTDPDCSKERKETVYCPTCFWESLLGGVPSFIGKMVSRAITP
jgi:hypothetical protein